MNKVNLCWVFADGRTGHDIQSMTLADAISQQVSRYTFSLSFWRRMLAPRNLSLMARGINWLDAVPQLQQPFPDLIITTGRQAASVGKQYRQLLIRHNHPCQHLQILNPRDHPSHYDVLLVPEHDQLTAANVISFRGSLHPYTHSWFSGQSDNASPYSQFLCLLLGNPGKAYWQNEFQKELQQIKTAFPDRPLFFCGSPRLGVETIQHIQQLMGNQDQAWFSDADGSNPYLQLLSHGHKLFVTADSINMMNECLSSPRPRSLLAHKHHRSDRHRLFIDSVKSHFSTLADMSEAPVPEDSISQVMNNPTFKQLISQA